MDLPAYSAELRAYFRAAAAQRRHHASHCRVCNSSITGLATRRYCSNACRQRAKRQRAQVAAPPSTTPTLA